MKKSKQTTTQNSTANTVTTPTNPKWVTDATEAQQGRIENLATMDPKTFVPGASALQTKAFDQAGGLGDWKAGLDEAGGIARNIINTPLTSQQVTASQARAPTAVETAHAGSYAADAAPTVKGGSLLDVDLQRYQNPFEDAVVKSSLANFDEQSGMEGAKLAAQQAAGQKFSGSGSAIERALFSRGNIQDRTGTESRLRSEGFDKATNLANLDLDRQTQAALAEAARADNMSRTNADRYTQNNQFNAGETNTNNRFDGEQSGLTDRFNSGEVNRVGLDNAGRADDMAVSNGDLGLRGASLLGDLSTAGAEQNRGDINLLSDLGNDERAINKEVAQAPITMTQVIADLNAKQPYDLTKGVTSDTTSSGTAKTTGTEMGLSGEDVGKIAAAAGQAMMASDRRLKTDVKKIAKDEKNRNVYKFRYRGEPKHVERIGYMAQELERSDPDAVVKGPGGYKMVNLGLLGA